MAKQVKHINKTPTEGLLKSSLLQLITKKPIRSISIKELCEHSGINRTTFYAHYTSISDVLNSVHDEQLDSFVQIIESIANTNPSVEEATALLLTEIYYRKDTYKILLSNPDCYDFIQRFSALLHQNILSKSVPYSRDSHVKYYPAYMTSGILACISKWVMSDCDQTPTEFASLLLTITHDANVSR